MNALTSRECLISCFLVVSSLESCTLGFVFSRVTPARAKVDFQTAVFESHR